MAGSKVLALEILDSYLQEIGEVAPELGKPAMMLRKRIAEKRADWTRRGGTDVSLVGRGQLLSQLSGMMERVSQSEGASVTLVGAPGIGKTRLAREALSYALLQGYRCVDVRADASLRGRPAGTLALVARELMALPGAIAVSTASFQLLQELAGHTPDRLPDFGRSLNLESVSRAFAELAATVSREVRTIIFVDDAHHVDDVSRAAVESASCATKSSRILWLATSRPGGFKWSSASINLGIGPLTQSESKELATKVGQVHGQRITEGLAAHIAHAAGGNPLFLREIAALSRDKGPITVPLSLQDIITSRLSTIDSSSARVLRLAALLGRSATITRIAELSQVSDSDFSQVIEALEAESILFLEADGSLGLHECWQDAVLDSMPPVATAALAFECASAIIRDDPRRSSLDDLWRAGVLFLKCGSTDRALDCLLRTTDQLLMTGMHSDADIVLSQASRCFRGGELPLSLKSRMCELELARGNPDVVEALTRDLPKTSEEALARGESLTDWVLTLSHRFDALGKLTRNGPQEWEVLMAASSTTGASAQARHYAAFAGTRYAVWTEKTTALHKFLAVCRSSVQEQGASIFSEWVELIHAAEVGTESDMRAASSRLETLEETRIPLRLKMQSKRFRSVALRMFGFIDSARELAVEAYERSSNQGQPEVAANCAELLAFLYLDQNCARESWRWIETGKMFERSTVNESRTKGLRHAELRWHLQFGDTTRVVESMAQMLDTLNADALISRRAGELLTYSLAYLKSGGDASVIETLLRRAEQDILSARAQYLLDYPSELLVRCFETHWPDDAKRVLNDYTAKRLAEFNRPLAPFFERLASTGAFASATIAVLTSPEE